jgi:hypothetical protein
MPAISSPLLFESYDEAIKTLNIPEGMYVFKITENARSLDSVIQGGQVLYKVGIGRMNGPGHPAGNQMFHRQKPIIDSLDKHQRVPVFRLGANGLAGPVEYLGMYKFKSLLIGLSFEGFKYYIFKMHRNPDTLNRDSFSNAGI